MFHFSSYFIPIERRNYVVALFMITLNTLFGQIKGKVFDSNTKEELVGSTIFIKGQKVSDFAGMDGTYHFKKIPKGTYTICAQFIGYNKEERVITLTDSSQKMTVNFSMNLLEKTLYAVEITVRHESGSDGEARGIEKNSENIVNVMSAKTMQLLPDISTAGILQRVSGVSLERTSTGDARYAIIRGMDQRYNYTLVNGIKIPSPDNKYRYVPMDMFPSDLLERLEVIKALTPSMEGDAIGGAMNLVMKSAQDSLTINANLGTGFSQLLNDRGYTNFDRRVVSKQSPSDIHGKDYIATPYDFTYKNFDYTTKHLPLNTILGFSIGDRFLKEKRLGVVIAASYQNLYRGSNSTWIRPNNQPQPGNVPSFDDVFTREYNTNQLRYGIHTKIDYDFNPRHKISLYSMYMQMNETQNRSTIDTSLSIGRSGVGTGNTYILHRSRIQDHSIYNATLRGDHKLFKYFKADWSGVYSLAKSSSPDWSEYQTVHVVGFDINHNQTATPEVLNIPFYRIWTNNSDRDLAGYLNLSFQKNIKGQLLRVSAGGLYRDKHRENNYNEWDFIPKTSSTGQAVVYDGVLSPDKFQFNGATAAQGSPINPLTYTATEKILAYYIETSIVLASKLTVLGGVRVEDTEQGWVTAQNPKISYGAVGTVPYKDILPSIHLKYTLTQKQNLRASYYTAINRPGFFEYVPFKINDDNFNLSGNPKLKHATSKNYDLRYEYFPKGFDQLLIGAFYKEITNPIETAVEFTGTSSATLKPFNFGVATNYGFEIALTKYWGQIGFSGNYTFTDSKITTSKLFYNESYVAVQTTQTRPLQGQSPHIANASILYKNKKNGLDAQLAVIYTGKKITFVSPYKDLDYWQRRTIQLDLSIDKIVFKHFTVYCKVSNLLNTPVVVEILQPNVYRTGKFALPKQTSDDRIVVQEDYYGQNYVFGIRYKLN